MTRSEQIAQVAHEAAAAFRRTILGTDMSTAKLSWEKLSDRQRATMISLIEGIQADEAAANRAMIAQVEDINDRRNNTIILGVVWAMNADLDGIAAAGAADDSAEGGTTEIA